MEKKRYNTPEITVVGMDCMSIMAGSLRNTVEEVTNGSMVNLDRVSIEEATEKDEARVAGRIYFDGWE